MTDMVSAETVTRVWQNMAQLPLSEVPLFVQQMQEEQPAIMAYLLAVGDALFNQHERETIFYVGMVVWQMMKQSKRRLLKVSPKKLDQAEEANFAFLERFSAESEADLDKATRAMLATYPESEVLRYIVEAIEEEDQDPDNPPIRDEYRGMAFVYLKTVLDALISSLAAAPGSRRYKRHR